MSDGNEKHGRLLAKKRFRFTIDVEVFAYDDPGEQSIGISNIEEILRLEAHSHILTHLIKHPIIGNQCLIDCAVDMILNYLRDKRSVSHSIHDDDYLQKITPTLQKHLKERLQNERFTSDMEAIITSSIKGKVLDLTHTEINQTKNDTGTEAA